MIEERSVVSDGDAPVNEQARRLKSSSLLWFISSRPYVPMADIRRRFGLATEAGTILHDDEGAVHIGLPRQAAETLLDLKRKQKVGLQYDLEYATRIVVGAYPIRIRLTPPALNGRTSPQSMAAEQVAPPSEVGDPEAMGAPVPGGGRSGAPRPPSARQRRRRRR